MLDITKIKSVSQTHIFFINDTHEKLTIDKAIELYNITSHLVYAIPILSEIGKTTHSIPFKEYKDETNCRDCMDKINIEISNKYARFDNENLIGRREQCRDILDTFQKFKRIHETCKEYIKVNS